MTPSPAISHTATSIIPADSIDYRDVEEICAYQQLICKIYECEGGFNLPPTVTPTTLEVSRQAKIWLLKVKSLIENILNAPSYNPTLRNVASTPNLSYIPQLLSGYGLLYYIAYSMHCSDYIRSVKLRTFDLWQRGTKSISPTDAILLLLSVADRDIATLKTRYADFVVGTILSWINELVKNGSFQNTSLSETYKRLTYLLNADLHPYMSDREENRTKARWISTHLLTDQEADRLDTPTLRAYAAFIDAIPFNGRRKRDLNQSIFTHLLTILASRRDTHPLLTQAIHLTLHRLSTLQL
ncbi:MAG: hypothetical protein NC453_02645 [Muribaculum sp.]|nr:hypothetical protein [Muribaculum sp.]